MEYRLVRKGQIVDIFDEEDSEHLGQITIEPYLVLWKKLVVTISDAQTEIKPNIVTRRRFTTRDSILHFRWKFLGKKITVHTGTSHFSAKEFERGVMVLKNDKGRTGLRLDTSAFKDKSSVLVEHYDKWELATTVVVSALILGRYNIW